MDTYLPPDFDLARMLFAEANKAVALKELPLLERVQAVITAYDRARADEKTVLPTYLMATIEALR